jgi:hypothetical protein
LEKVFSWADRDTEKACLVITLLNEEPDKTYPLLAKAKPVPIRALPWGLGKWRLVYPEPSTAEKLIQKRYIQIEATKIEIRPPDRTFTYHLTISFITYQEKSISDLLCNMHLTCKPYVQKVYAMHQISHSSISLLTRKSPSPSKYLEFYG